MPLAVAIVAVAAAVLVAVAPLGRLVVDAARARTAADAAALAAAEAGEVGADPHEAAQAMAEANGGRLVELRRDGSAVTVVVAVGRARASARAASLLVADAIARPESSGSLPR